MNVDLLSIINTPLRKVSNTNGGEYAGPCPFCGGKDRFRVQPVANRWWCRQCSDRWSNDVGFVMKRDNVGIKEAIDILNNGVSCHIYTRTQVVKPVFNEEPTEQWRSSVSMMMINAITDLHSSQMKHYLTHDRMLLNNTIKKFCLGYISVDREVDSIFYSSGIVIPWYIDNKLYNVKIRRYGDSEPKYTSVKGGHQTIFGAQTKSGKDTLVLTEGEFDCMLLWQETKDLADVMTLGGCSNPMRDIAKYHISQYENIFICYDNDEEGLKGSGKIASANINHMRVIRTPARYGKDITDARTNGLDLHAWLEFEIKMGTK